MPTQTLQILGVALAAFTGIGIPAILAVWKLASKVQQLETVVRELQTDLAREIVSNAERQRAQNLIFEKLAGIDVKLEVLMKGRDR